MNKIGKNNIDTGMDPDTAKVLSLISIPLDFYMCVYVCLSMYACNTL